MNEELLERLWNGGVDCSKCRIREMVLFANLEVEDFNHIHMPIHDLSYGQGEVIYTQGEQENYAYTIRSGLVKFQTTDEDKGTKIVRLLKMGDFIGLEAILGNPYRHTAVVLEPAEVCRIPVEVIHRLKKHSPNLCDNLLSKWESAVSAADHWLRELNSGQSRQRVILLIKHLVENSVNQPEFFMPSRDDMSSILGITKETVSRVVAELKRDGALVMLGNGSYEYRPESLLF